MTATPTADTAKQIAAQIREQKRVTGLKVASDAGVSLAGFGVAALFAVTAVPATGIVVLVAGVIGITNAIDTAVGAAKLSGLNKAELELAAGRSDDTRKRSDTLGKWGKIGRNVALGGGLAILGIAATALFAPAVLPAAAASAMLGTIAWPTLGLLAVSRSAEAVAAGGRAVLNAVENPAPATPAAAAPEAAPAPKAGFTLRSLLGPFGAKAKPANNDNKPQAPEAKAAAPASPKP